MIFYKQLICKLPNKAARCCNQFILSDLRWAKFKVIKTELNRAYSNASPEPEVIVEQKFGYLRNGLRAKEEYHHVLFDRQLVVNPEKFKILDNDLITELQDWVFAAQTENRCVDKNDFVMNRKQSLMEKLERCDLTDCFKVLAFCRNVYLESHNEELQDLYFVIADTMFKEIDESFARKIESINVKDAMLMADAWILLGLPDSRLCTQKILDACLSNLDKMADHQIIFTCYILGHMRKKCDFYESESIQKHISPILEKLSIDELAVVCFGLERCRVQVFNEQIRTVMLDRFASEIVTMDNLSAKAISNLIYHFSKYHKTTDIANFQDKLIPQLHKIPLLNNLSILFLGGLQISYNETLVRECIKILIPTIMEAGLKSLERILKSITMFKYEDDELFRMIIEILTMRIAERNVYPISFIRCTHHLLMRGPVPSNFIKFSLAPEIVEKVLSLEGKGLSSKLGWIDAAAELESPNYDGPRLSAESRHTCIIHLSTPNQGFPNGVGAALTRIYGKQGITQKMIMSHFQQKFLIIGFDRSMNPILPPKEWRERDVDIFIHPPDDKNFWIVPHLIYRGEVTTSGRISGFQFTVSRFLRNLGYCVLLIDECSWQGLIGYKEKETYLRICIANRLHEAAEDMEKTVIGKR